MTWMTFAAAALATMTAGTVAAQDQSVPPSQSVAAANHASNIDATDKVAVVDTINAASQASYAQDLATYRTERRIAAADIRLHARQERAYADAMAAWRIQVEDCRRGRRKACNAPTPNPADFE